MKKYIFLSVALLHFCSCFNRTKTDGDNLLINYSSVFIAEDGEALNGYYIDRGKFIKPYFSVKYINDTIVATTLYEINACGKTEARVKMSGDTLFLQAVHTGQEMCSSVVFHKYTYYIRNTGNKKFIVKG